MTDDKRPDPEAPPKKPQPEKGLDPRQSSRTAPRQSSRTPESEPPKDKRTDDL